MPCLRLNCARACAPLAGCSKTQILVQCADGHLQRCPLLHGVACDFPVFYAHALPELYALPPFALRYTTDGCHTTLSLHGATHPTRHTPHTGNAAYGWDSSVASIMRDFANGGRGSSRFISVLIRVDGRRPRITRAAFSPACLPHATLFPHRCARSRCCLSRSTLRPALLPHCCLRT